MKISKNKKVPRSKGVFCSLRTDGQTDTKLTTVGTLPGFQEFFLQPIIKDRPNIYIMFVHSTTSEVF